MRKLLEVQEAKELMTEAMDWSSFKWLFEKSKVRETADRANAALDKLERSLKARWSEEAKAAYKILAHEARAAEGDRKSHKPPQDPPQAVDPQIRLVVENVVEADDTAKSARKDAEDTFDDAERQMSTSLAREGCKKAIHSWELHEKAIRKAEAVSNSAAAEA